MLETLDYTIRIGSIPTFLYFDLYLYSAYAAHFVDLKYNFRETRWEKGVILDEIVDESTRQITRAANKTFTDLSLTKTDGNEWGKEK